MINAPAENLQQNLFDITNDDIERALEEMFSEPVERIDKGVGFCDNVECVDYCQGVFLILHTGPYFCRRCAQKGFAITETGRAEIETGKFFGEVRVRFDYAPALRNYLQTAIIRDDSLGSDCGIYYMESPMCRSDKRAFAIGERLLSLLNDKLYEGADLAVPPPARENILDLDQPMSGIRKWLGEFEIRIKRNPFFQKELTEGIGVVSQVCEDLKHEGEDRGPQSDSHHRTANEGP